MENSEKYVRLLIREYFGRFRREPEPLPGGVYVAINKKFGKNLRVENNKVISYWSHVADIEPVTKFLFVKPEFEKYSVTTSAHLRAIQRYYDLKRF
jgi:hypothetical protein